jgi:hypothetical protein
MKTINVLSAALLLCFVTSASLSIGQTKNAATDKQRQENLDKLQKQQAKQRDAYNKMTEEQKAVARTKAMERKTGKTGTTQPVSKTGVGNANSSGNNVTQKGTVNAKPINVPKKSKPTPVWKSSKDGIKINPAKPTSAGSSDKKQEVAKKPSVLKTVVRNKQASTTSKETDKSKKK